MDWYHLALFAHILGVLGLFMALGIELATMLGASRARTVEAVRVWSSASKPLAVVFPVTSVLILAAGLVMTIGAWGWGQAWIDLSLALLVLFSFMGAIVNDGFARRIARRASELADGPIPPDFAHELRHPIHWTSVLGMAMTALGIVFLMVEKPGLLMSLITLIVALLIGVMLARSATHSKPQLSSTANTAFTDDLTAKV